MVMYEPCLEVLSTERWAAEEGKENFRIKLRAEIDEKKYLDELQKFCDARLRKISELKKKGIKFKDLPKAIRIAREVSAENVQMRFFLELKNALLALLFKTDGFFCEIEESEKGRIVAGINNGGDGFNGSISLDMVLPRAEQDKRGRQRWIYPPALIFFYDISGVGTREGVSITRDSFNLSKIIPSYPGDRFSGGEYFDFLKLKRQKSQNGVECSTDLRGMVLAEDYFPEDFFCRMAFEMADLNAVLFRQKRDGLFSALYKDSELSYKPVADELGRVEVMIGHKDEKIKGRVLLTKINEQLPLFLSFGYKVDVSGDEEAVKRFLKDYWPSSE